MPAPWGFDDDSPIGPPGTTIQIICSGFETGNLFCTGCSTLPKFFFVLNSPYYYHTGVLMPKHDKIVVQLAIFIEEPISAQPRTVVIR